MRGEKRGGGEEEGGIEKGKGERPENSEEGGRRAEDNRMRQCSLP